VFKGNTPNKTRIQTSSNFSPSSVVVCFFFGLLVSQHAVFNTLIEGRNQTPPVVITLNTTAIWNQEHVGKESANTAPKFGASNAHCCWVLGLGELRGDRAGVS
jgi:hypothetical protein